MTDEVKIGDILYRFDENRRVYDKPGLGGKIIYAEHFTPFEVVGETRGTWLVRSLKGSWEIRVNKKTLCTPAKGGRSGDRFYTAEGRSDNIWRRVHVHWLVRRVEQADTATLKRIAEIVGYDVSSDG